MDILVAMDYARRGLRIRRSFWPAGYHLKLTYNQLHYQSGASDGFSWKADFDDIVAKDWVTFRGDFDDGN